MWRVKGMPNCNSSPGTLFSSHAQLYARTTRNAGQAHSAGLAGHAGLDSLTEPSLLAESFVAIGRDQWGSTGFSQGTYLG